MSLVAQLIARVAHRYVVPMCFRAVKRFPPLFAGVALVGQTLGAWLVCECGQTNDWPMASLGVLILGFYTGLLGMLAVKSWNGTWSDFCDYVLSLVG